MCVIVFILYLLLNNAILFSIFQVGPPFALVKAEVPWSARRGNLSEKERVLKKVKGILNKLTLEKFELLKGQLLDTRITTADILKDVTSLIFRKAVSEPTFCSMYAQLCYEVHDYLPSFPAEEPGGRNIIFRRLLLNNCQQVFEDPDSLRVEIARLTGPDQVMERGDQDMIFKLITLGNIRLIGELTKARMVPEKIVHHIIKELLGSDKKACPDEEHIEALCQFFNTVGKHLDENPGSCRMNDTYFIQIKDRVANPELTPRSKFMLLDLIALRSNNWVPRRGEVGDVPCDIWHWQDASTNYLSNLGYIRAETEKLESEMKRIALEGQQKQTCKLSDEDMKITRMTMLLTALLQDNKDCKNEILKVLKLTVAILFAILCVCVVGVMKK
ncbi:eukaryotic translation initiation factor-like isoform X1 [Lolium rigidum]|uniref:eukaryotic translation initiation factor-like isoform X1 n=1 Tax=Lolium rigidum TaxID=89674 RepID=UPI001F5DB413|nr:eukaryotic translation initiation factor-like isoform X1 [Lolium rigidum]XP_047046651.1 eukaryotic translation initiation factor-like isoform X1 [Lolium rigidum]XP_047046652.1 eukaryotic translation initiation factor-like isoform X1 [Lolium rigidum]XP_047046653.1 eukaryotic translation initiation factor-like isoform X1 [Lolium rigidum]